MTIEVNWKRIRGTHRDLGGDGRLILEFTSTEPIPIQDLDDATGDGRFPVGEGPAHGDWLPTPKAAYLLLEADGYEGVEEWIQGLVDNLTGAGVSGTLSGARGGGRVPWAIAIENHRYSFSAMMRHQPLADGNPLRWGADPDLKSLVVRHGLDWALDGADRVRVWNRVTLEVDAAAAAALAEFFMERSPLLEVTGYDKPRQRVRRMTFQSPATIELSEPCLDPASWPQTIADLRSQLLAAPHEHLLLAQISPHTGSKREAQAVQPYIHDQLMLTWHPQLYGEWVDDPCGIQILTTAHLAKAHDLSAWLITEIDAEHWLVEAKDLAAWYSTPIGAFDYHSPALIQQARTDFGDMILTPERALALGIRKPTDP